MSMCVEEGCLGLLLKEETLGVFFHVEWGEMIGGEVWSWTQKSVELLFVELFVFGEIKQ